MFTVKYNSENTLNARNRELLNKFADSFAAKVSGIINDHWFIIHNLPAAIKIEILQGLPKFICLKSSLFLNKKFLSNASSLSHSNTDLPSVIITNPHQDFKVKLINDLVHMVEKNIKKHKVDIACLRTDPQKEHDEQIQLIDELCNKLVADMQDYFSVALSESKIIACIPNQENTPVAAASSSSSSGHDFVVVGVLMSLGNNKRDKSASDSTNNEVAENQGNKRQRRGATTFSIR